MQSWRFLILLVLALVGCKGDGLGTTPKVDNPVVGPPPPRRMIPKSVEQNYSADERNDATDTAGNADVALAGFSGNATDIPPGLEGNRVVATVNGAPIFEAEVLERYGEQLGKFKEQVPPEQYRSQCDKIIERDLRAHIEQKMLSEAMRRSLKKDQQKQFDEFTKKQFQEKLDQMKADFKVASTAELDREMQRRGTSLAMMEHQVRNRTLAQQYIATRLKSNTKLSRQDLFAYYQQHKKDYEVKAQVRWQQILISRRNEQQARAKLQVLVDGLKQGRDFGDLAADISDGPTADEKGVFDWTNRGSLADAKIDELLFKLPVGEPSELITTSQSYQVVRVLERKEAGHVPFDEVQDKIREQILEAEHKGEVAAIVDELWQTATVDTPYKVEGVN